jgi:hypothetical protein
MDIYNDTVGGEINVGCSRLVTIIGAKLRPMTQRKQYKAALLSSAPSKDLPSKNNSLLKIASRLLEADEHWGVRADTTIKIKLKV